MPKYQFPLSDQDDYRGRVLFTTIIETPASIDQAALDRVSNATSEGIGDVLSALKDFGTKEILLSMPLLKCTPCGLMRQNQSQTLF